MMNGESEWVTVLLGDVVCVHALEIWVMTSEDAWS